MNTKLTGKKAEDIACSFLIQNRLVLIIRNYHCRHGEIDLIMQDSDTLVFIEVCYRKNNTYGSAAESVNRAIQRKIIFSANHYLTAHPTDCPLHFDIVALSPNQPPQWINNAFNV